MKQNLLILLFLCFTLISVKAQYPADTLIQWALNNSSSATYTNSSVKAKNQVTGNKLNNISYTNGYQKIAPPSVGWSTTIDTTASAGVYIDFPFGLVANYNIGYGCKFLYPDKFILSGYTDATNDSIKITPYLYDSSLYVDSSIFCFWDTTNVHSVNYSCGGGIGYDYYKYIAGNWYYFHFDFSQFKFDSSIVPNYYQQLYPAKAALVKGDEFYISSNSASNPNNILNYIYYANNNFNNERLLFLRLYVSSSNPNANLYLKQLNIRGGFLTLLPVAFNTFTATKNNNNVYLNWSMKDETNIEKYVVEKSNASNVFETIQTVLSSKNIDYASIDANPNNGTNIYRIKAIAKDGEATYSSVVKVLFNDKNAAIAIYPNPVKDVLTVKLENSKTEKAIIQITDLQGRILQQKEQKLQVGNNSFTIDASSLAKGIYSVTVKGSVNRYFQFVKE